METDEAFEPPASGLVVALDSVAQHSGLLGATPSIAAVVVLAAVVVPCGTAGESTLPVAAAPQFESAFTLVQFFVAAFGQLRYLAAARCPGLPKHSAGCSRHSDTLGSWVLRSLTTRCTGRPPTLALRGRR